MAYGRGKADSPIAFSEHPGHGNAGKTAQSHEFNRVKGYGREAMGQLGSNSNASTKSHGRTSMGY